MQNIDKSVKIDITINSEAKISMELKKNLKYMAKSIAFSIIIGIICGAIGTLFSKTVALATAIRTQNTWLLFLLPIAGILTVLIYKLLKIGNTGTIQVFNSAKNDEPIPIHLAPAIFLATVLTHLCGGSAGKEGAALQIGGGVSAVLSRIFKLDAKIQKSLILCGMAALFSAVFGTPLAAAVFVIEAVRIKKSRFFEIIPCFISSLTAFMIALLLKAHPERFTLSFVPDFSAGLMLKIILISIAAAIIGIVFYLALKYTSRLFKFLFKNDYIRIVFGGIAVILISIAIKNRDYNGSSIEVITRIFDDGEIKYEAFALKLLLTAVTMGSGYKGGEIIPSLFIGSALGGAIASVLELSVPFGAAIGMAALFCSVTKCPIASILLCFELFSGKGIVFLIIAVIIGLLVSGNCSLYGTLPSLLNRYLPERNTKIL